MRQHTRLLINGKAYQTKVKYKFMERPEQGDVIRDRAVD
jgi:hypothetical protein